MRNVGVGFFKANDAAFKYVNDVLKTGRISYGKYSQAFERAFAQLHGTKFAVLSNSGTSSLHVALQSLKEMYGWKDGDEVIVPSITFVATVNIVLHNRMKPVLVDVEPDYYGINPCMIQQNITDRTRAIIPVHLFGQPCDMIHIHNIASMSGLSIIEDSCETMFADYANFSVGSWGSIGCFSSYVAHLLSTGVGGIATTKSPEIAAKMRSLVNHGRDGIYLSIDDDDNVSSSKLKEIVSKRFQFDAIGHSFRITELEAAIGLSQLEEWEPMVRARRENAAYLTRNLADLSDKMQLPAVRPSAEHSFMMYPVLLKNSADKWPLCNFLEERGIETREMLPLINQPCYKGMWEPKDYPIAAYIGHSGFYIGCHQGLSIDDLDYIVEAFHDYMGSSV